MRLLQSHASPPDLLTARFTVSTWTCGVLGCAREYVTGVCTVQVCKKREVDPVHDLSPSPALAHSHCHLLPPPAHNQAHLPHSGAITHLRGRSAERGHRGRRGVGGGDSDQAHAPTARARDTGHRHRPTPSPPEPWARANRRKLPRRVPKRREPSMSRGLAVVVGWIWRMM